MDELDIDIQVLQETGVFETEDIETGLREMPLDDLRISLIAQDGSVLYDNDANVGNLGNHGDRPEGLTERKRTVRQTFRYHG